MQDKKDCRIQEAEKQKIKRTQCLVQRMKTLRLEKKERMDIGWGKRRGMLQKNKVEGNGKGKTEVQRSLKQCRIEEQLKGKMKRTAWRTSGYVAAVSLMWLLAEPRQC